MLFKLNEQQHATVLAALRYWQREGLVSAGGEQDIATNGDQLTALSAEEIDGLCEDMNHTGLDIGACIAELADDETNPYICAARAQIAGNDDLSIDNATLIAEGDEGAWVLGWLYVSKADLDNGASS